MKIINAMKLRVLLFLMVVAGVSCSEKIKQECPQLICTQQFVSINVQFKDVAGKAVAVTDFKAVNKRSGKPVNSGGQATADSLYYTIASDALKNDFSAKGDQVVVTATHPQTKKTAETGFVISGGKCSCHVTKLSGPEEIVF